MSKEFFQTYGFATQKCGNLAKPTFYWSVTGTRSDGTYATIISGYEPTRGKAQGRAKRRVAEERRAKRRHLESVARRRGHIDGFNGYYSGEEVPEPVFTSRTELLAYRGGRIAGELAAQTA